MSMRYRSACLAAAVLTLAVGLGKPVYADKPADLPVDPRVTCTPGAATGSDGVRYITLREAVLSALMRSQAPACGEEEAEAEEIPENPVAVNQCDDTGGLMFGVGVNSGAGLVRDIVLHRRHLGISPDDSPLPPFCGSGAQPRMCGDYGDDDAEESEALTPSMEVELIEQSEPLGLAQEPYYLISFVDGASVEVDTAEESKAGPTCPYLKQKESHREQDRRALQALQLDGKEVLRV